MYVCVVCFSSHGVCVPICSCVYETCLCMRVWVHGEDRGQPQVSFCRTDGNDAFVSETGSVTDWCSPVMCSLARPQALDLSGSASQVLGIDCVFAIVFCRLAHV